LLPLVELFLEQSGQLLVLFLLHGFFAEVATALPRVHVASLSACATV